MIRQEKYSDKNPVVRLVIGRFFQRLGAVLAEIDPHSVLDAGCGEGEMLRRGVLPSAVRPVCLDLRPASLAEVGAERRVCGSVFALPFAGRSFDTVTCLEVLEHLDDPAAAVRELARVARRAIVVSVPLRALFPHRQCAAREASGAAGQSPRACATLESPHLSGLPLGLGDRSADRRSVSLDHRVLPSKPTLIFLLLAVIGVARIAATYRSIAQTSDETPNIACGMQYLDLGRYDYGAFHPPLARLAMAAGPYLYGARAQKRPDRWQEGNAVLNSAPRYGKALTLARLGILPFFLLACTVVWLWGRKLLGDWGALAPVFLFTNTPAVLAHAGLATMDMAIGAGIVTALFTYTLWLEQPSLRRAVFFGVGLALAILSKFSARAAPPGLHRGDHAALSARAAETQLGVDSRCLPADLGRVSFLLRSDDGACGERRGRTGRHLREDSDAAAARAGNTSRARAATARRPVAGTQSRGCRAHGVPAGAAQLPRLVVFLSGRSGRENAARDSAAGACAACLRYAAKSGGPCGCRPCSAA